MASQDAFRRALLDAKLPVPGGLQGPNGAPAGNRYSVYRNNVTVSLCQSLGTAFPLVRKLIGAAVFGDLAPLFVQNNPPRSPVMMFYGAEFPEFLAGFAPLSGIGYLPDAARLDLAMRTSYHAADAALFAPAQLAALPAEDLANLRFTLAPATQIIRSRWPLYDIWRYNFEPGASKPQAVAQDIIVTRPEYDPTPHVLPEGAAIWLEYLSKGERLEASVDQTLAECPAFDFEVTLGLMLRTGAFCTNPPKDTLS